MGLYEILYNFVAPAAVYVVVASLVVVIFAVCYLAVNSRNNWVPAVRDGINSTFESITSNVSSIPFPGRNYLYSRLPSSFAGDMEAGLSSSTFDLSENLNGGDSRAGLDNEAKSEILKIMKTRRLKFDQARRAYMEQRFAANGIGADGRPRDPKFVSFS